MPERKILAEVAAKIADIANDCFDRPAADRLRDLYADLEKIMTGWPAPEAETKPTE
jgi:hypothetical protein